MISLTPRARWRSYRRERERESGISPAAIARVGIYARDVVCDAFLDADPDCRAM